MNDYITAKVGIRFTYEGIPYVVTFTVDQDVFQEVGQSAAGLPEHVERQAFLLQTYGELLRERWNLNAEKFVATHFRGISLGTL